MSKAKEIPSEKPQEVLEAEEDLERYTRAEKELLAELEDLVTRLEQSEGEIGDRILEARLSPEAEDPEGINQEHTRLWLGVDTTRRALRSAGKAKAYAHASILTARAHEKRREAGELKEEGRARLEITNRLLEELRAHEGAQYHPPLPIHPSGAGYAYNTPSTKSQEIFMNAAVLEEEALRLEEEASRIKARAEKEYARPQGQ